MDGILYSHMFELIFKNTIDPIILEKLKRVHIHWKKTIDKIFETTDIWKRTCLNEIPSEPISCMVTRMFPTLSFENYHELDDPKVWRTVYISYRKWMILSKLRVSVEAFCDFSTFPISSEKIISFASCDKHFVIGTNRGTIYVFDFNQLDEPAHTINFDDAINDIRFWYPGTGDLFLVVLVRPYSVKFLNAFTLSEVPGINFERPEATVLSAGTINMLFTMNLELVNEYKYTENGIRQYSTGVLRGICLKLYSENKKLIYAAFRRNFVTLENHKIATSEEYNDMLPENVSYFSDSDFPIYDYSKPMFHFLTPNIILQKSTKGNSCLIICDHRSNWNIHYPFGKFGNENLITSGVLHGKILILGFQTGHVRIFTVETFEQLKNPELDLHSGIEYHIDTKPIQWLQVAEAHEKLIIIAITDDKIYSINLISKKSIK